MKKGSSWRKAVGRLIGYKWKRTYYSSKYLKNICQANLKNTYSNLLSSQIFFHKHLSVQIHVNNSHTLQWFTSKQKCWADQDSTFGLWTVLLLFSLQPLFCMTVTLHRWTAQTLLNLHPQSQEIATFWPPFRARKKLKQTLEIALGSIGQGHLSSGYLGNGLGRWFKIQVCPMHILPLKRDRGQAGPP